MNTGYHDVLRVRGEADAIPQIEHAWLFDHLMPIGGDPNGPTYEGWTLLAALAAQTQRLRLGPLVTSNRMRPPAMLAKIAATVDIVSGGRLDFGIGAGSRPDQPLARREYEAHGLPFQDSAHAAGSLAEACTIIGRLWTESDPFDFDGEFHQLVGRSATPNHPASAPAHPDRWTLGRDLAGGRRTRRPVEHPRRRHRRCHRPQRPAGTLLRRDRPRPRLDHPIHRLARLLRSAKHHPRRDHRSHRRGGSPTGDWQASGQTGAKN